MACGMGVERVLAPCCCCEEVGGEAGFAMRCWGASVAAGDGAGETAGDSPAEEEAAATRARAEGLLLIRSFTRLTRMAARAALRNLRRLECRPERSLRMGMMGRAASSASQR